MMEMFPNTNETIETSTYVSDLTPEIKGKMVDALELMGLELKCPVCLGITRDPISLPCNHFYCNNCIDSVFANNGYCPTCRTQFQRRQKMADETIRNMARLFRELHAVVCQDLDLDMLSQDPNPRPRNEQPEMPAILKDENEVLKERKEKREKPKKKKKEQSNKKRQDKEIPKEETKGAKVEEIFEKIESKIANEDVCAVCCEPDGDEDDQIILCDGCDVAVHQICYGVSVVPQGSWFCDKCTAVGPTPSVECVLCPNQHDKAYKPTTDGRWVHTSCALWHTGPQFVDSEKRSPVTNCDCVPNERFQVSCRFCKKKGACIQCTYGRCAFSYHVPCGMRNGILYEIRPGGGKHDVYFHSFCEKHQPLKDEVPSNNSTPKKSPPQKKGESVLHPFHVLEKNLFFKLPLRHRKKKNLEKV